MLTIDRRLDGVLHILADAQLTADDFDSFVPRFEALAGKGPAAMLIELGPGFSGWSAGGLWQDLRFDAAHMRQFGRIAVLGDKRWEKWGTQASAPLFPGEMRFFEREERRAAEEWLREREARA